MAPAANKASANPSTNLLADIFSSLLWVLLTGDAGRKQSLPADYVWHRGAGQARVPRSSSMLKTGAKEMKISVVVPAFNEERLLPGSLSSIRAAMEGIARRGWESELIVCDNNSTDRTAEIAKGAGAQVVFEPVNQIGRARNTGAARARGDWIFFVDADSRPGVELFLEAADCIHAGRCLAGGSTVAYEDPRPGVALLTGIWNAVSRINKWAAGAFI